MPSIKLIISTSDGRRHEHRFENPEEKGYEQAVRGHSSVPCKWGRCHRLAEPNGVSSEQLSYRIP